MTMARIKYQEVLIDNQDRSWTTLAKVVLPRTRKHSNVFCTYVDDCDIWDDYVTDLRLRTPSIAFFTLSNRKRCLGLGRHALCMF